MRKMFSLLKPEKNLQRCGYTQKKHDIAIKGVEVNRQKGEKSRLVELAINGNQLEKVSIRSSSKGRLFSKKRKIDYRKACDITRIIKKSEK